nr:hypothetical protein [Campylobacter hyointestinalis]
MAPSTPKKEFLFDENEVLTAFKSALENQDLIIESLPIMGSKIHRVKTTNDKGRELSGAYSGFSNDYLAGFVQNFKTSIKENWKMHIEKKSKQ